MAIPEQEPTIPLVGVGSDHDLMERAKGSDQQAVGELYVRYRRRIISYLYRFTGSRAIAEELMQETFLRVFQHADRYQPTGSVAGWIYRIAGNLALNHLRVHRGKREVSLDESLEMEENTVERMDAIAGPAATPAEQAEKSEREVMVQKALLKVSPSYREVVILCDIEGHAYREVAEILSCSINTVASRLARGRAQLAHLLGFLRKEVI